MKNFFKLLFQKKNKIKDLQEKICKLQQQFQEQEQFINFVREKMHIAVDIDFSNGRDKLEANVLCFFKQNENSKTPYFSGSYNVRVKDLKEVDKILKDLQKVSKNDIFLDFPPFF